MRAILSRLTRLENRRDAERPLKVELQKGRVVKHLPSDYSGERHLVEVGRDPNGDFLWEQRPGPEPPEPDDGDRRLTIRMELVAAKDGRPAQDDERMAVGENAGAGVPEQI